MKITEAGKADPARMTAFMQKYPETTAIHAWMERQPAAVVRLR
jgi:hypothetical protein